MAGQARYTAVLEACVLYSIAMTDALLSLATAGLFAAKWTTRIEREWMRALEHTRPELVGKLEIRRDCMRGRSRLGKSRLLGVCLSLGNRRLAEHRGAVT
jgi:hypothetical protein